MTKILIDEALDKMAENARELGLDYMEGSAEQYEKELEQPAQQEPVAAIRSLTNQCAALIQERNELQRQVWRYEKNGVTCQTYRHTVEQSCSECNVQMNYTAPPAPAQEPLTVKEIAEFVGTHEYGPEQLKWFRFGEAAHGITKGKP